MARTRRSTRKLKHPKVSRYSRGYTLFKKKSTRKTPRKTVINAFVYNDRLKTYREQLSAMHSDYDADPDDEDTTLAIFIVSQQLVKLFRSNQTMRNAVEEEYPVLLDADEAAENPIDIIEATEDFLLDVKNALMQNPRGPLYHAEVILYNRLPDALDYKMKAKRDELVEMFNQMSVGQRKSLSTNNALAEMMRNASIGRRHR